MSFAHEELLLRLAGCCCPHLTPVPVSDANPLLAQGCEHRRAARYLFTPNLPLWNARYHGHVFAFHVGELNFDTLAQCHTIALDKGMAQFNPAAKHSATCITAVILCDTAQADALEALVRFKKRSGHPLTFAAKLDYRLVAVNLADGQVVCNRRARRFKTALQTQLSEY